MVTVYIGGGLANKMFQYAISLAVKRLGYDVAYDTHSFKTEFNHDVIRLDDIFKNVRMPESHDNFRGIGKSGKIWRLWKRINPNYIIEHAYQYNNKVFDQIKDGCILDGSWQDEKYFLSAKQDVQKAFQFPEFTDDRNISLAKEMEACNSVSIHLRKGDGYGTWNIFSNTCEKDYYDKAIAYIKQKVVDPKFFVFTDRPDLVKDYLDLDNYTLVNWNPTTGLQNYLDMQLMSCAKHNIIANSTYSWWGAWLNKNPNKITIAPKYWFSPQSQFADINHIIPENWVKM